MLEGGGHHPDHFIPGAIERDLAADDLRIGGKAAPPQAIAEHHHGWRVGPVVLRQEVPTDPRSYSEHAEVIDTDAAALEALGQARSAQRGLPHARHRHRFKGAAPLLHLEKGSEGHLDARATRGLVPDGVNAIARWERQRLHQHGTRDAEHRRHGTDPETKRRDGDEREARIVRQPSQAVAQVGGDRFDHMLPPRRPHLFADGQRVAHAAVRGAFGISRRHAVGFVCRGGFVDEVLQFLVHMTIRGPAVQQRPHAARELAPHRYHPSAFRSRAIADARRPQSAVATSSCFRPVLVSE